MKGRAVPIVHRDHCRESDLEIGNVSRVRRSLEEQFSRSETRLELIPGGLPGSGPKRGIGRPDVALVTPDAAWIWEVKHNSTFSQDVGIPQLRRYLAATSSKFSVPTFAGYTLVDRAGNSPTESIHVFSAGKFDPRLQGLELYDFGSTQPEPDPWRIPVPPIIPIPGRQPSYGTEPRLVPAGAGGGGAKKGMT